MMAKAREWLGAKLMISSENSGRLLEGSMSPGVPLPPLSVLGRFMSSEAMMAKIDSPLSKYTTLRLAIGPCSPRS